MKCAWVVLAAVGLVGCAPLWPPAANQSGSVEIDCARMAAVERAARAGGVQVVWINAPRKAGS
jgi:hypothetical protein